MVKDYAKSVKGTRLPVSFRAPASQERIDEIVEEFVRLRGDLFTASIVCKEYVDLVRCGSGPGYLLSGACGCPRKARLTRVVVILSPVRSDGMRSKCRGRRPLDLAHEGSSELGNFTRELGNFTRELGNFTVEVFRALLTSVLAPVIVMMIRAVTSWIAALL